MTRQEHLDWSKSRALEYIEAGDSVGGLASIFSDLSKHPETREHSGILLGTTLVLGGYLQSSEEVRKFIEGFN